MRAFLPGRVSQALLCGALIVTAVSTHDAVVVEAQAPTMRWDGLIELVSGRSQSFNSPLPADGPSQMSRHAVSGDGRYVVFTANAPALAVRSQPSTSKSTRQMLSTTATRIRLA